MGLALLFLGLFPVVFLADLFVDTGDVEEPDPEDDGASVPTGDTGDFISGDDDPADGAATEIGIATGLTPLPPILDDPTPYDGADIDPGDVLSPVMEDATPHAGSEIDPGTVLSPIDAPGEEYSGDGTDLQQHIADDSDFTTGLAALGEAVGDTPVSALGGGDDVFAAPDDGLAGTGSGEVSDWDGTPILSDPAGLDAVAGGDGDDAILLGDRAGYAFGGAGDDSLTAGNGAAALFGGAGDDTITGSDTGVGLWADGGSGNDVIAGGAADDTLFGGAHAEGSASGPDDDLIDGGAGDDHISGGFGADTLRGGEGDDVINHLGRVEEEISWERHAFDWHIDGAADSLDGGAGNDQLIMDLADSATGGDGNDTFWVYADGGTEGGAAEIEDFSVGEDFLRIELDPTVTLSDPEVTVGPSDDGQDAMVRVNGEVMAILRGAPDATVSDVYVTATPNIFVA